MTDFTEKDDTILEKFPHYEEVNLLGRENIGKGFFRVKATETPNYTKHSQNFMRNSSTK